MSRTSFDTVETLIENVLAETEDPEVHFKLRTALQLLVFLEEDFERTVEELGEADLDPDLRDRLVELGYIE